MWPVWSRPDWRSITGKWTFWCWRATRQAIPIIRNELIRLAVTTGGDGEVVESHAILERLGGVGALLRYRHEPPEAEQLSEDVSLFP